MKEVRIVDMNKDIEMLRIALAMSGINVNYQTTDLIQQVFNDFNENGGSLTIDRSVKVQHRWKNKWEKYFKELEEIEKSDKK